jgi:hypothetical protein
MKANKGVHCLALKVKAAIEVSGTLDGNSPRLVVVITGNMDSLHM